MATKRDGDASWCPVPFHLPSYHGARGMHIHQLPQQLSLQSLPPICGGVRSLDPSFPHASHATFIQNFISTFFVIFNTYVHA